MKETKLQYRNFVNRIVARCVLVSALVLTACATNVRSNSVPAEMAPISGGEEATLVLPRDIAVSLASGFSIPRLKSGSRWAPAGVLPTGTAYKPLNSVLQVGESDRHEAYLVVHDANITGVYLPVERAFVKAAEPIAINELEKKGN